VESVYDYSEMKNKLTLLNQRISLACSSCNRSEKEVTLIWVSKFHPQEAVDTAYAIGAREFGENRVQEAIEKFSQKKDDVRCHIIGPVQSNKLKKAALVADVIHSMDSLESLEKLNRYSAELNKVLDVLIQVNTSEEDTKSGLQMADAKAFLESLPAHSHLRYRGLMSIGKNTDLAEDSRAGFSFLRALRDEFVNRDSRFSHFTELSMGMTGDLEVAIEEGATMIRVGTALFGSRQYNA
jgi:hypothetical protein